MVREVAGSHTDALPESLQGANFVVLRRWRRDSATAIDPRASTASASQTAAPPGRGRLAAARPAHADGAPSRRGRRGRGAADPDHPDRQRCLKGQKTQALKDYNHNVSLLAQESDDASPSALRRPHERREQVGAERRGADRPVAHPGAELASQAKKLSAPGDMAGAQRNLCWCSTASRRAHEGSRSHSNRARRRENRRPRRSPATWRSSSPPTSSTPSGRTAEFQQALTRRRDPRIGPPAIRFLPQHRLAGPATVLARITRQIHDVRNDRWLRHARKLLIGVKRRHETSRPEPELNPRQRRLQPDVPPSKPKRRHDPRRTQGNVRCPPAKAVQGDDRKTEPARPSASTSGQRRPARPSRQGRSQSRTRPGETTPKTTADVPGGLAK